MSQVVIDIPEEALSALDLSPEQAGATIRLAAAIKLFELGRLSSGAAAQLADISRVAFLSRLAEYGVDAFDLEEDDLRREVRLG